MRHLLVLAVIGLMGCIPAGDSEEFGGSPQNNANNINNSNNANNPVEDTGLDSAVDVGSDVETDTAVETDLDVDAEADSGVCVPLEDEAVCNDLSIQCGAARGADNCGETRNLNCGQCSPGAGCASGQCVETECRDSGDNDGDGMEDCADSDCLNKACDANNAQLTCNAGGQCM